MKQMTLKFNTYVKGVSVVNNNIEKFIFNFILWSFGALALFYIIFLGNMVKNIVQRQGLETQARSLSNEVQNLEVTYLSLSNNVDLTLSNSLGFKEVKATFANRKALGFNSTSVPFGNIKIVQNDI
ncbi:MAG: hypothetical protein NTZ87_01200 [Candidatus Nomurabacteria bacterium]|nr:hypothetical protein [Candidatus Nomurabacteria bacterium]